MAIDSTTIILTAIFTGIGVSVGNSLFEIFLKDYFIKLKHHKKKLALLKKDGYKRPWLAAIFNFFIWGLGYFYVKKKRFLGVLVFIVQLFVVGGFSFKQNDLKTVFESLSYSFLSIIIGLFLAYDAYRMAHQENSALMRAAKKE